MAIDPDYIYSKYGRYARLSEIAARKARDLEIILNADNKEALERQINDERLLKALKAKDATTFAELAYMCEREGRINRLQRDDIAKLIGFFDEYIAENKEKIEEYRAEKQKREEQERQDEQRTNNKKYKRRLLDYLIKEYEFDGFHHYTDFSNLASIFESGFLYARNAMENDNFYDAARTININRTPDYIKSYVRLFYKKNTPTTYTNEGIIADPNRSAHMPIPVLLLFSKELITHDGVKFLDGSGSNLISDDDVQTSETDLGAAAMDYPWEYIFERGSLWGYTKDSWPLVKNLRNAEFLYPQKLDLKYLDRIVFRTYIDMQNALVLFNNEYKDKFVVDSDKFNKNKVEREKVNYPVKYDVKIAKDEVVFDIEYHNDNVDDYQHSFILHYHERDKEIIMDPVDFKSDAVSCTLSYDEDIEGIDYYMDDVLCIMWRR